MDTRVTDEERDAIYYTLMALKGLRKTDASLTLPAYVRKEIASLVESSERFRAKAKTAGKASVAEYMFKQAERLNRNACVLITLRAKFASWRE